VIAPQPPTSGARRHSGATVPSEATPSETAPSEATAPSATTAPSAAMAAIGGKPELEAVDWRRVEAELDRSGHSVLPGLLTPAECATAAAWYEQARFRSTVVMARHDFGSGEYKYFDYPLPEPLATLRPRLYEALVPTARRWHEALGLDASWPATHAGYLERCRAAGQSRPTPLLLRYGPDDYNCLHQDVYGQLVFPLQVAILLSEPERDFSGGELVLTEQRPRRQARVEVVPLGRGDAVVFAVRDRPAPGKRGVYRVQMRHGVSRIRTGQRLVLGIIFHDALEPAGLGRSEESSGAG
jgi:uncharacterized protein